MTKMTKISKCQEPIVLLKNHIVILKILQFQFIKILNVNY